MNITQNDVGFKVAHPDYEFAGYGITENNARNDIEEKLSIASLIRQEKAGIRPNETRVFQINKPNSRYDYGCTSSQFVALGHSPADARQNIFELQKCRL